MSIAKEIGNNLINGKYTIDNILRALLTNNNNISEYKINTTYMVDDVIYRDENGQLKLYRAINDNFTESIFTESNWELINIENFYFGDNSPEISDTEPNNNHTKIWLKPID